jgi:dipeptidyl aminopeptidase/acylaminoacyl peptidase
MRIRTGWWSLGLTAVVATRLAAQGGTEIWVAPFHAMSGHAMLGTPVNVSQRPGYDNQPAFTPDGRAVWFTRITADAPADIWRVGVDGGAAARVTDTPESEYSATLTPDGLALSVIRVERDSTQRLWRFPLDGGMPTLVLRVLRPVGYHVWVNEANLGAFVLGDPNALVLVDPRTERVDTLARDIGRALVRVPGRDAFTFLQVGRDTSWISEVDVRTRTVRRVAPAPAGSDYHAWTPDGRLLATAGSRLLLRTGDRWEVVADLAGRGIRGLSRIVVSSAGDRVAFVADEAPSR